MGKDQKFQEAIDKNIMTRLIEKIGEFVVHATYTDIDMVSLFDKVILHEVWPPLSLSINIAKIFRFHIQQELGKHRMSVDFPVMVGKTA